MVKEYKLFINGEWVEAEGGKTFDDINPATGEVYAKVAMASRADAQKAIHAAYQAWRDWALKPAHERAAILYKASQILEQSMQEYASVLQEESGSVFIKSMFETGYTIGLIRSTAEDCKLVLGETFPSETDKFCMTIRQPRGVIAAISPWNFPLLLSINKVGHSLAAGNTVVLKPSSETPVIGLKIAELFEKAGLPAGVLNVVTGPGPIVGDELVVNPKVKLVTLTGETVTGRKVAEKAGANLKPVVLELGGKDPVIVLKDADLDYAVDAVCFGAFMHQGEICMSVERVIVEKQIADEFSKRLATKAKTLRIGDPKDPKTIIGPLINQKQLQTVDTQVRDAVERGAKLMCGGKYKGLFYEPTVLTGVTREMRIFREETFGPTAPITAVKDVDEAIEVANDTEYGLSSGVITNDLQKALYIAERLESGMVHINDASVYDEPYAPFGGVKASGIGREGGKVSMDTLTELKWITIQKGKRHFPF
jgi:acyl-CoA reductase-like NAD-dependent aldehyde dehydrogenase